MFPATLNIADHTLVAYGEVEPACYRPGWVGLDVGPVEMVLEHTDVHDLMKGLLLATISSVNQDNCFRKEGEPLMLDPDAAQFLVPILTEMKPLFDLVEMRHAAWETECEDDERRAGF